MAELPDRSDLLARITGLDDEELERVVEMLDAGVFLHDPPILDDFTIHMEYATPEDRVKHQAELKRERQQANAQVGALMEIEPFRQLQREVVLRRDQFWAAISRGLSVQEKPTSQRELDFRRGFYKGAVWAVLRLPAQIERARRRRALLEGAED